MIKKIVVLESLFLALFLSVSGCVHSESNFSLFDPGAEKIVNYEKYGDFLGVGTKDYKYVVKDQKGLAKAIGEGIYPNTESVLKDPAYQSLKSTGKLEGDIWAFVETENYQANFFKWATTEETKIPGLKLYFTGLALEKAGLFAHAIKAYYALAVNFPKTMDWTFFHTPWYPARVAIDKIIVISRNHPELGMKLVDTQIRIGNGYDNDPDNDVFIVNPGKIVSCPPDKVREKRADLSKPKIIRTMGRGRVQLVQFDNRHWQMRVDGKPFTVKSVAYTPNKVGLTPDNGSLVVYKDWMVADFNKNGKVDGAFDAWVDKNRNNQQDPDEPAVGDFQLMKEMGVNAIRVYHHSFNKDLLRSLYENYGIMVMMGDYLGAYAVGSGAAWNVGTDYTYLEHQKNMIKSIKEVVMEYKDEPYILMWVLGNENNYGVANNANVEPVTYYRFANHIAKWIKSVDPNHPVAICNGDVLFLDIFTKYCPDIDIYGCNSYRGKDGFGKSLWESVKEECDKPGLITEYGCPAYAVGKSRELAEEAQAEYHKGCWEDIIYNSAGLGIGNAIGGVAFEWLDEWWKDGNAWEAGKQGTRGNFKGPFLDGWLYEEWLGICSQGDGTQSPFLRHLRPVYYLYQELWKK